MNGHHGDSIAALRALVGQKRDEIAHLERTIAMLGGELQASLGVDLAPAKGARGVVLRRGTPGKPTTNPRRAVPTPDAGLQADVLGALRKLARPAKWKEVAAKLPQVKGERVVLTLRALAARKEVVKTGATLSLRYALPEFVAAGGDA